MLCPRGARRGPWRWSQRSWRNLAIVWLGGRSGVIGSGKPFGARPFGEHAEEAGDIVNDLAGVLVGEIAPDARLPELAVAGSGASAADAERRRDTWVHVG